jgi:hypothetical protein
MAGMLQIITYLLGVYLIVKGIEVLQIALCSGRERREAVIGIGVLTLVGCVIAAGYFVFIQDQQAAAMSRSIPR